MSPLIIALDFPQSKQAFDFIEKLDNKRCRLKIGKELFTCGGPVLIEKLIAKGFDIFLDLKYHDIPNTVARACTAAANLGVWMLNVHALGGRDMLLAAREALEKSSQRPLLIAVTILTSFSRTDMYIVGLHGELEENILRLARLSHHCGLDGVVCSPHEITSIRYAIDNNFKIITPGLRPEKSAHNDQKRVMTPNEALELGANYLVVGRPITAALDPLQALLDMEESFEKVLNNSD